VSSNKYDGTDGWRAGIMSAVRVVQRRQETLTDLQHPAYRVALGEVMTFLEGMLARNTEKATTPLAEHEGGR
jgi:hypothetical protein